MSKPSARERILDIAETAVLAKGFAATSIDEIVAELQITKSGFFYHFHDKNALALGLLARYSGRLHDLLEATFGPARRQNVDPLEVLLGGLTHLAEHMARMPGGHPGCLLASLSYQDRLFDREVRAKVTATVRQWNAYFTGLVEDVVAAHRPSRPIDAARLARSICCAIDGGIVMSKSLGRPEVLPEQMLMVRDYVHLLFAAQPVAYAA